MAFASLSYHLDHTGIFKNNESWYIMNLLVKASKILITNIKRYFASEELDFWYVWTEKCMLLEKTFYFLRAYIANTVSFKKCFECIKKQAKEIYFERFDNGKPTKSFLESFLFRFFAIGESSDMVELSENTFDSSALLFANDESSERKVIIEFSDTFIGVSATLFLFLI